MNVKRRVVVAPLVVPVVAAIPIVASLSLPSCRTGGESPAVSRPVEPGETRLRNVRQLTFRGENAEAYFSADGTELIYQASRCLPPEGDGEALPRCDQIFRMRIDGGGRQMVSTGKGRTTCAYFLPDGSRIVYASTHLGDEDCPPVPEFRPGRYVWPIHETYDIFSARPDGNDLQRLTTAPGYDAEATVSPDGSLIVFTSVRDGDLELYTMRPDGTEQTRITHTPGYDGGAFFSPDGKRICYRASRPRPGPELDRYRELLAEGLVEPSRLEIFVADADGSNVRQVTDNGAANFCPFFHPSGEKIIYASNRLDPRKRNFDLFLIDLATGAEERVTHHEDFDGFPMFSPDGRLFVWCSNRFGAQRGDTNVFIAEWVEN